MTKTIRIACIAALGDLEEKGLWAVLEMWTAHLHQTQNDYASPKAQNASPWCRLFAHHVDRLVKRKNLDEAVADCRKVASEVATWAARQNTKSQ